MSMKSTIKMFSGFIFIWCQKSKFGHIFRKWSTFQWIKNSEKIGWFLTYKNDLKNRMVVYLKFDKKLNEIPRKFLGNGHFHRPLLILY